MIGKTVSHYKITRELGAGGMGVVYEAVDTKLDRTVALKFLPPESSRDSDAKARFIHEAKAASALDHKNVCTIHEIDETEEGQLFLAMACYEGETLQERIARGPLPVDELGEITRQVAEGLAKAHELDIVHRDIKPANIFITNDGLVKILDFGLAKLAGQTLLTKTGSTMGTVSYMSPEQASGRIVDHRSDLWSLGIILYEMATGRRPFLGEHHQAVIYSILNCEPDMLSELRADLPTGLEEIVTKFLMKEPGDRYQSADECTFDLVRMQSYPASFSPISRQRLMPSKRRLFNNIFLLLGTMICVALLVVVPRLFRDDHEMNSASKRIAVLPFKNLGSEVDEYFTDGLTYEIMSRLGKIKELGVISRTSSGQYKNSSKSLPLIAEELQVEFVLEGTAQWIKTSDSSRVRITPNLVDSKKDVQLWSETFDIAFEDIFATQARIASLVASALDIALDDNSQQVLEMVPTNNSAAYNAYLQALVPVSGPDGFNRRVALLERATQLDSTFALAFTELARTHIQYYWAGFDRSERRLILAKNSLNKSFVLQPELPQAFLVLGEYYYKGFYDYENALQALEVAGRGLPNSTSVMTIKAAVLRRSGDFDTSLEYFLKAYDLDPQNSGRANNIGDAYRILGNWSKAVAFYEKTIESSPAHEWPYLKISDIYLKWRGDIASSRKVLGRVPLPRDAWYHLAWLDIYEGEFQNALDRLEMVGSKGFVNQEAVVPVELMKGIVFHLLGDEVNSDVWFESAKKVLESDLGDNSDDYRLRMALGMSYAGLGQPEKAISESQKAIDFLPLSMDAVDGVYPELNLMRVHMMLGQYEAALDKMEFLLALPAPKIISVPMLKINPMFDPLLEDHRFKAILSRE